MKSNNTLILALLGFFLLISGIAGYRACQMKDKKIAAETEDLTQRDNESTDSGYDEDDLYNANHGSEKDTTSYTEDSPKTTPTGAAKNNAPAADAVKPGPSSASPADKATRPSEFGSVDKTTLKKPAESKSVDADDAVDKAKSTSTAKATPTAAKSTAKPSPWDGLGKFVVQAGAFKVKKTAESEVKRIQKLGYARAKTVSFDGKNWAIVADWTWDRNKADAMVSELKTKHGIVSMVKTKPAK